MSGIYGVFSRKQENIDRSLRNLAAWCTCYGSESAEIIFPGGGAGCVREHFSSRYGVTMPPLRRNGRVYVLDALLYNRDELLPRLAIADETASDEEVLMTLLEKEGFAALRDVNGDFAGAVFEETSGEWTLFRDHLGVRPLYYYRDEDTFAFSTELRGLCALPGTDLSLDEEQLYLTLMGSFADSLTRTEYRRIRCVKPATCAVLTAEGSWRETRWWEPRERKIKLPSEEAYRAELRRLVTDAVQRRMDAMPQPLGAELSGGLDSGVIDILIHRLGGDARHICWCMPTEAHPLQENDERLVVQAICEQEGLVCEYLPEQGLDEDAFLDEKKPPFSNTSDISRTAAALRSLGARSVFSGQGGDEGVSHRMNPAALFYHGEYGAWLRENWGRTQGKSLRVLRFGKALFKQVFIWLPKRLSPFRDEAVRKNALLTEDFCRCMKGTNEPPLYFGLDEIKGILTGNLRHRLDNTAFQGAENGVRYLFPYLDYRVFDYALSIPRRLFLHNGEDRYIFRETFKDIMPEELRQVHYKEWTSLQNYEPEISWKTEYGRLVTKLTERLDRKRWEPYLDFDRIEKLKEVTKEQMTDMRNEYMYGDLLEHLYYCLHIQNLQDNAARWAEEHAKEETP